MHASSLGRSKFFYLGMRASNTILKTKNQNYVDEYHRHLTAHLTVSHQTSIQAPPPPTASHPLTPLASSSCTHHHRASFAFSSILASSYALASPNHASLSFHPPPSFVKRSNKPCARSRAASLSKSESFVVGGAGPWEGGGGSPSGVEVVEVWVDGLCEVGFAEAEEEDGVAMVGMDGG